MLESLPSLLHIIAVLLKLALDVLSAAGAFDNGFMTYFFLAFFVPSFVLILTVILYFIVYFIIAAITGLILNTFGFLATIHPIFKMLISLAVAALLFKAAMLLKKLRARSDVVPLNLLNPERTGEFGNKAASLATLSAAGLRVPFGYAVSSSVFDRYAKKNGIEIPSPGRTNVEDVLENIRKQITDGAFTLIDEFLLRTAYFSLWLRGGIEPVFIIRSSFGGEDAPGRLAPGQYASYSSRVPFKKFTAAVRECWCSYFTPGAWAYREKMGAPHDGALSLILQNLLKPELIGTAAGANPATGFRDEYVVDVSAPPSDEPYAIAEQGDAQSFSYSMALTFPDLPKDPRLPFLPELMDSLRKLGVTMDDAPLVEWAYHNERLYFLQLRPLSGLPKVETYISAGMVELTGERLCPMSQTLITKERELDSFITEPLSAYIDEKIPREVLKVIDGRVFASYEKLLEIFGMMKLDPAALRKLLGVCTGKAAEIEANITHMDRVLESAESHNIAALDPIELRNLLFDLNRELQGKAASAQAMAAHLAQVLSASMETVAGGLGIPVDIVRSLPAYKRDCIALERMRLLAEMNGHAPETIRPVKDMEIVLDPEGAIEEYIKKFGYLCPADELDLTVPRISEDSDRFRKMMSTGESRTTKIKLEKTDIARTNFKLKKPMRYLFAGRRGQNIIPWDTIVMGLIYKWFVNYSTLREELRYRLLRGWRLERQLILQFAKMGPYGKDIDDPELIFFMDEDDLLQEEETERLADKARERRKAVGDTGPVEKVVHLDENGEYIADPKPDKGSGAAGEYSGRAASAGSAAGVARYVTRPEETDKVRDGDIAVVDVCSPWMSVLFARAGGAVALSGGVVSHLCLAAREYGAPMIVSVHGVEGKDLDGKRIEIDSASGRVKVLEGSK